MSNSDSEFNPGGFIPDAMVYVDRLEVGPVVRISTSTSEVRDQLQAVRDRVEELTQHPDAMVVTYDRDDEK
ncbi:hypothetical protein [Streptomyces achromogenes]|uniref:hypothetical protein n=1 Tax=Streptomyces achromogenes TaxID=67255 RepID=UPI003A80A102